VLENVSLAVSSGEICCILGPNGVGKTTLFKSILRLLPIFGGEIRVDGENIAKWPAARMAATAAYVAQVHVPPFPYRARDVVMLGRVHSTGYFKQPTREDNEIADRAMREMGVFHLAARPYTEISGGERQLVMLARALAQEPKMLVLDEPTANLDYGNQVRVLDKICALRERGYAVIMTTHSPDQAFICKARVALITRERNVIYGGADEVITERNLYDAYGVRARVVRFSDEKGNVTRACVPLRDSAESEGKI
jgi:iron complex transport system ATP-binding protein